MMNKITYTVAINTVIENEEIVALLDNEIVEKLKALKGSLEKKAENKKESAKQKENSATRVALVNALRGQRMTIKDIQGIPEFAEMSNQKISALLSPLVKDNVVTKEYEKKTPFFSVAETE